MLTVSEFVIKYFICVQLLRGLFEGATAHVLTLIPIYSVATIFEQFVPLPFGEMVSGLHSIVENPQYFNDVVCSGAVENDMSWSDQAAVTHLQCVEG